MRSRINPRVASRSTASAPLEPPKVQRDAGIPRWISILAALLVPLAAFMYMCGYAYDQGYLAVYGLSNEFFPRSLHEYLVLSYMVLLGIDMHGVALFTTQGPRFWLGLSAIGALIAVSIVLVYRLNLVQKMRTTGKRLMRGKFSELLLMALLGAFFVPATVAFVVV